MTDNQARARAAACVRVPGANPCGGVGEASNMALGERSPRVECVRRTGKAIHRMTCPIVGIESSNRLCRSSTRSSSCASSYSLPQASLPCAAPQPTQQAGKVHRIGFLRDGQPPPSYVEAFQQGLREWGYVDGRNVVIEFRTGNVDQLPQLAEELVRLKVDVIVASAAPSALAAKKATTSVPIVFVNVLTLSSLDSSRAWHDRERTSRDWPSALLISPGSVWSC